MHQALELDGPTRLKIAALTGLAGLATAFAVSGLSVCLPRMLPETGFHLAAAASQLALGTTPARLAVGTPGPSTDPLSPSYRPPGRLEEDT